MSDMANHDPVAAHEAYRTAEHLVRAELAMLVEAAQRLAGENAGIVLDRIALEAQSDQLDACQKDLGIRRLLAEAGPYVVADARALAADVAQLHEDLESHVAAWATLNARASAVAAGTEQIRLRALELAGGVSRPIAPPA
jgi:hypothetical protein